MRRVADGDPASDLDGLFDEAVTFAAEDLERWWGEATLGAFEPGDVVVMVDPSSLAVAVLDVEPPAGQGSER